MVYHLLRAVASIAVVALCLEGVSSDVVRVNTAEAFIGALKANGDSTILVTDDIQLPPDQDLVFGDARVAIQGHCLDAETLDPRSCEIDMNDNSFDFYEPIGCSLLLQELRIVRANNAVQVDTCNVWMTEVSIEDSIASSGAALSAYQSAILLEDCVFQNNDADQGGAIDSGDSTIVLKNCVFTNNTSEDLGNDMNLYAGGNVVLIDTLFIPSTPSTPFSESVYNTPVGTVVSTVEQDGELVVTTEEAQLYTDSPATVSMVPPIIQMVPSEWETVLGVQSDADVWVVAVRQELLDDSIARSINLCTTDPGSLTPDVGCAAREKSSNAHAVPISAAGLITLLATAVLFDLAL